MKSLPIDTASIRFLATGEAEQVVDFETKQPKADRDGQPIFAINVLAIRDGQKGDVITVKVAGAKPSVAEGQKVKFVGLEALPWSNNGRSGLSYSAQKLDSFSASTKAA